MANRDYLGIAIKFPVEFDNGKVVLVAEDALLAQSIREYLDTQIGTRFFLNQCGSRIRDFLFEPNDSYLEDMLYVHIRECIDTWEKRVEFISATFTRDGQRTDCSIKCVSTQSNLPFTFVYPYYRKLKY